MLTANIAATAIGAGLLYVIYEFVLRGYQADQLKLKKHIFAENYTWMKSYNLYKSAYSLIAYY